MAITAEDICAALRKSGADAWQVTETRARSTERYTVFTRDEALRQVDTTRFAVTVHVHHALEGKPTLGESTVTLGPDVTAAGLQTELAQALARAALVHNARFALPAPSTPPPDVANTDARVVETPAAVVDELTLALRNAVAQHKGVELSSSELFASYESQRILNSAGLDVRRTSTDVMMEYVLLAGGQQDEVEIYQSPRRRLASMLDLSVDVGRYVQFTRDGLRAGLPQGGTFDVVLGEEALDSLFDFFMAQAQASARYEGWSRLKVGEAVVPQPTGDRLTLWSDPALPGGSRTQRLDGMGAGCVRTLLVEENIFRAWVANKKYADLVGVPVTGPTGNTVVKCGTQKYADLLRGGPTFELLRFSTFTPNPVSGAFSGEIRTGYFHDQGKVIPVKGGSVTGTVLAAFQRAFFSAEETRRQAYLGPKGVLLKGLTLAGE